MQVQIELEMKYYTTTKIIVKVHRYQWNNILKVIKKNSVQGMYI